MNLQGFLDRVRLARARARARPTTGLAAALTALAALGPLAAYAGPPPAPVPGASAHPAAPAPAPEAGGPRWSELGASQRQVLAPLGADWNSIDARGKERWLAVAARFHQLPPQEQKRATERMVEWSHMTPQQRTQARLNFEELRTVSQEERKARWQAYQALPEDKKQELAKRAAAATAPPSAASSAAAARHRHPPLEVVQPKTNVVQHLKETRTPVDPGSTVLQVRPGATTTLLTRRPAPPDHQHEGQPKIAAGANVVDRTTLLPRHAASATLSAAAASTPTRP